MARDVVDTLSIQINTSASSAIKNIDQLQKRLQSLAKTLSTLNGMKVNLGGLGGSGGSGGGSTTKAYTRLSAAFNAASQASSAFGKAIKTTGSIVGTVSKKILGHFGLIGKGAQAMFTVADGIKSVIGGLIGFKAISGTIGFLRESIQYGADITEIDHIVESVFGNMSSAVNNFAEESIEKFGLAAASAKQYAGFLSAMFQASNIDYKTAGEMGANLTALAGDLSAFFNISQDEAFEKIRAGMSGMVRPLRAIGIDLTAATLSEYALAQGIQKSYTEMTQAEKVMLRYNYLMDHTRTQQDDFQRTQYSMANATRTLTAYTKSLQTAIGEGLVAAIRPAVVALNTLMKGLLVVARAFATFMQTIFGKYKGGASGIAVDLGESDEYMDDLAGGAGAAADSLDSAAGSAKQLKKDLSVLPFDELNQLNKDREVSDSGSGGGGAGGGGGLADFGLAEGLFNLDDYLGADPSEAISEWGRRIRSAFDDLDFLKMGEHIAWGLNEGLNKIYSVLNPDEVTRKVRPFINGFTTTFNSLVSHLNFPMIGSVIGAGINNIYYVLENAINGINFTALGEQLGRGANGLVNEVDFTRVGQFLGGKFMVVWDILSGFVHNFKWDKLGDQLATAVNNWNIRVDFSKVGDALVTGLNGAFTTLFNFTTSVNWGQIGQNIVNGLNTFIHGFNWLQNGQALNQFIQDMLDTLVQIATGTDWTALGSGIGAALSQIDWGAALSKVFTVIKEVVGGIWSGLGETAAGAFLRAIIVFKIGSKLLPFFNNIAVAITGDKNIALTLGSAIAGKIGHALSSAGAAISSAIPPIVKSWAGMIGNGMLGALETFFTGAGATIGGIAALVVAGFKTWRKEYTAEADEMEKRVSEMSSNLAKSAETIEGNFKDSQAEIQATAQAANPYLETLKSLEGQTNLTAQQQYELQGAVKGLNDLYPNLGLNIDSVTGSLNMSVDQIEDFIDSSKKAAEAQAYFEVAKGYYKDMALAQGSVTEAEDAYARAVEKRDKLLQAQDIVKRRSTMTEAEFEAALSKTGARIDELGNIVSSTGTSYMSWDTDIRNANEAVEIAKTALDEATGVMESHRAKGDEAAAMYGELSTQSNNAADAIERELSMITQGSATYDNLHSMLTRLAEQDALTAEQQENLNWVLAQSEEDGKTAGAAYMEVQDILNNYAVGADVAANQVIEAQRRAKEAHDQYVSGVKTALDQGINAFQMYDQNAEDIFEKIKNGGTVSVDEWINNLDQQIEAMHGWEENLQQLTSWGIDQGFLQELIDGGVEGRQYAQWIVDQGAEEFARMNEKYKEAADVESMTDEMGKQLTDGLQTYFNKAEGLAEDGGKAFGEGYAQGQDKSVDTVMSSTEAMLKRGVEDPMREKLKWHSPSGLAEDAGKAVDQGLVNGMVDTGKLSQVKSASETVIEKLLEPFKDIGDKFKAIANTSVNALNTAIGDALSSVTTSGEGVARTLQSGIVDYWNNYGRTAVSDIGSYIRDAFNLDLYEYGQAAARTFANGIQSVWIPTPHVYTSRYNTVHIGDESVYIPEFAVQWYKAGGLFRGGQGQVIGIAEGGKDEAVLPLENTQAMREIAGAILNGMQRQSAGTRELPIAIADAMVNAMARNPQTIDFHNETVLMMQGDVLARHVDRELRQLEQRYRPA